MRRGSPLWHFFLSPRPGGGTKENGKAALLAALQSRPPPGLIVLAGVQGGIPWTGRTRPAGWNIIGRTPLELVNVADGYFPLRAGDRVRFERIDEAEFHRLRGQRL